MDSRGVPSDIVESTLLAVLADPLQHLAVLTFRMKEREFRLRAEGVKHMLVNEFLQQNIVDRVHILNRDSDRLNVRNLIATLLFDCEHASEVSDPQSITQLDDDATAVIEGRKILLEVAPVYGASVLLLATSLEWLDGSGEQLADPRHMAKI
jgi:hypothetical protein